MNGQAIPSAKRTTPIETETYPHILNLADLLFAQQHILRVSMFVCFS